MNVNEKGLKYGYLVSHTFPGLLIVFEAIVILDYFSTKSSINCIVEYSKTVSGFTALVIVAFALSTTAGIIIDAFQHYIVEIYESVKMRQGKIQKYAFVHSMIKTEEQLKIYAWLIDDNEWYYYESYINIAICMIPGLFVLFVLMNKMGTSLPVMILVETIVCGLIVLLFRQGWQTYLHICELENQFGQAHGLLPSSAE
ncbi:MAG: hypothetical protein HY794_15380 [Desulfarculus sp.]|nr:hypothetical protein [Desulfarculus sp.]